MPKNLPSASVAIGNLQDAMFADLDHVHGGCSWWHGYQDWPRLVVINDYLLQTVGTLTSTTLLMAHHLQRFEERWTSENHNARRLLQDTGTALGQKSPLDEARSLDIQVAVRGFFDTAAHTLDLVATLFVGICALKADLKTVGWKVIPRARDSIGQRQSSLLYCYGTDGRKQQETAIRACISSTPSQPEDWIEWTLHTRHTFLHRAGRMRLQVVSSREDKGHLDSELFYFLPVHPRLSDAEVMGQSQTIKAAYLPNHAADLMRMIHSNAVELVAVYCRALEEVWIKRRDNPLLLVQPEQQWHIIEDPTTQPAFAGARQKVRWPGGSITINPKDEERWEAAKVMDADAKKHWGTHR